MYQILYFLALYGILFPGKEEAAYSNFRLWESTGSVITYIYSPYLCIDVKLYLLLCLLIIGACGYTAVEVIEWKGKDGELGGKREFKLVKSGAKEKSFEVADWWTGFWEAGVNNSVNKRLG